MNMPMTASHTLGPSIMLTRPASAILCIAGLVQSPLLLSLALHRQDVFRVPPGQQPFCMESLPEACKRGACTVA